MDGVAVYLVMFYFVATVGVAISAFTHAGIVASLCAVGAPTLALSAAGGAKSALLWAEDRTTVAVRLIIAILLFGAAYALARGFSVNAFGYQISGVAWTALGALVGGLFITKSITGE